MNSGNVASGGAAASSSSGSRSGQAASTDSPPGFRPQAKPVPVKAMPKRPDAPPAKAFLPPSPLNNQPIIASPCSPRGQDTLPASNSDMVDELEVVGAGYFQSFDAFACNYMGCSISAYAACTANACSFCCTHCWDASATRSSIAKKLQPWPCEFAANATSFSSTAPGDVTKRL